tara:strand:+ start:9 stop:614 length:606 start_codon:yes stop_codon:yes gene_type:complete
MLRFLFFLFLVILNVNLFSQSSHYVEVGGSGIGGGAYYFPQHINITVGDTVVWENVQGTHNVNGNTQTFPNNPESFQSGSPQGAPWTYSFVFNTPGVYDYECSQGNHSVTQFGTVTVSAPLNYEIYSENKDFYFDNLKLYFNENILPVSFKIFDVKGVVLQDFVNYNYSDFSLNQLQESGVYVLSLFSDSKNLFSNYIFVK